MTGAVDWYIGKLLGVPKSSASAQLRLMASCCFASAFLNNTPIVALMIPIVLRWSRTIRVSNQQLLIPLSFGTIFGGTCTLIGTSTNLVISGLLEDDYSIPMNIFDVTPYGVPVAIMGIAYMIIFGPILLPGGRGSGGSPFDGDEILLGARITSWAPAAGRSVKRSGLRDTGGLYLVSVRRAATGNIHRAVGQEFILNVNDILYFSGLIEGFGEFCHEHGLELVTNESSSKRTRDDGATSLLQTTNDEDHLRNINQLTGMYHLVSPLSMPRIIYSLYLLYKLILDIIQGVGPSSIENRTDQIFIATDSRSSNHLVLIGINASDRPGLLLEISKSLLQLNLQQHRSEAAVFEDRSLSVWRCTYSGNNEPTAEEISSVLSVSTSTSLPFLIGVTLFPD